LLTTIFLQFLRAHLFGELYRRIIILPEGAQSITPQAAKIEATRMLLNAEYVTAAATTHSNLRRGLMQFLMAITP